ncbi:PIR Superfamily Protein [Plasmodium ovale curtisi]|uniref:PIR Superfamily Protein n=1 Tax=Plasmodium ovale curtisi TaxID=864141 RepID=A0A1A8XCB9_PLAOA|nr:PIR Superfamily Protein [Plasmodium ovale curtisi]SBT02875.1 PIR Superfamily Protein [Plasmodium ovale curtisi]
MSPNIPKLNKATIPYAKYQEKIDSYDNDYDHIIPGCNRFVSQLLNGSAYSAAKACSITIRLLSHLKDRNDPSYEEYGCKYLFHWLYSKVLSSKKSTEDALHMYKELNTIFNENNDGYNKFDKYINEMNKDTIDKLEKIINIYNVFNTYIGTLEPPYTNVNCTSACIDLFTSYAKECRQKYDFFFCKELKDFREQYNVFIEKIILCKGEQYLLPSVEFFDTLGLIVVPTVLILVTSFVFPFLYKFTAFGPWINRIIGKNRNIWENINEDTNYSLNEYEMENKNSKKSNYNIAYNSS